MRFKSNKSRYITEATSSGVEGDYEGEMSRSELKTTIANCKELLDMIGEDEEIEAWVQSKITKAADYISSVRNYMVGDTVNEAVGAWQRKRCRVVPPREPRLQTANRSHHKAKQTQAWLQERKSPQVVLLTHEGHEV
jgi:hypothetical protein